MRIGVYGEVDLNLLDGSAVWLQSAVELFAATPGSSVMLLLRAPERRDLLTAPLRALPNVRIIDPGPEFGARKALSADAAARALAELHARERFDIVVLRGANIEQEVCRSGRFTGCLWPYYVPGTDTDVERNRLADLARESDRILCQTEAIRTRALELAPEAGGRLVLLPPMVPDSAFQLGAEAAPATEIVYSGKLAPEYFFLEMVEIFGRVRERHPGARLHVLGDKIHNPKDNPSFRPAAERALEGTPNLIWHGAMSREDALARVSRCGLAFSVRTPALSKSAELSTKVLEYGAARRPVLLNRTTAHEALLGSDYPLFADTVDQAVDAIQAAIEDPRLVEAAAERCFAASAEYAISHAAARLRRHVPPRAEIAGITASRLAIAGHNLGFARALLNSLSAPSLEVRKDQWVDHSRHDREVSGRALDWAETLLCEWCLGNALFYSRRKLPGQRLVVRFHRMELETRFPRELDLSRVDAMVFVAEHVKQQAVDRYGWPEERLLVIPNGIETTTFRLPKLEDATFTLGLVGYVPMLKRLDRALDMLEVLRTRDRRFRLIAKGHGPSEFNWMKRRAEEMRYYEALFARVEASPLLRHAVVFEPHGALAPFFQKVGFVVSLSNLEGHAVAVAEGMASGCVQVVMARGGASDQYAPEWIHRDPDAAAEAILRVTRDSGVARESSRSAAWAQQWDVATLAPRWRSLLGLAA
jgi:glycosyltransferase involved in cell wall biosynthesis